MMEQAGAGQSPCLADITPLSREEEPVTIADGHSDSPAYTGLPQRDCAGFSPVFPRNVAALPWRTLRCNCMKF